MSKISILDIFGKISQSNDHHRLMNTQGRERMPESIHKIYKIILWRHVNRRILVRKWIKMFFHHIFFISSHPDCTQSIMCTCSIIFIRICWCGCICLIYLLQISLLLKLWLKYFLICILFNLCSWHIKELVIQLQRRNFQLPPQTIPL